MNKLQKARLVAAIKADAALRYSYINDDGECCVIGGLMLAAKAATPEELKSWRKKSIRCLYDKPAIKVLVDKMMRKFGLSFLQVKLLQRTNDRCAIRDVRQDALVDHVKRFRLTPRA